MSSRRYVPPRKAKPATPSCVIRGTVCRAMREVEEDLELGYFRVPCPLCGYERCWGEVVSVEGSS
jgi:hypothetical protein